MRETKKELDEVLKESRAKEQELQGKLTEEGTLKERLDASLAADRVQSEEAVATLRAQLAEVRTRAELTIAVIDLYKAMGGG